MRLNAFKLVLTPVAEIVMASLLASCYYPVPVPVQAGVPVTTTTTTSTTSVRPPASTTPSPTPSAVGPAAPNSANFAVAQIDQMMAPIALYPDALLSQVLMAATYPADVADAARWSKAHSGQSGDAAVKAVDAETWDASVKSLVAFPQVIQTMGDKPDWVQNLGDAFLASSKDVLDSAQRLRAKPEKQVNSPRTNNKPLRYGRNRSRSKA